jgi:hypothetical protein
MRLLTNHWGWTLRGTWWWLQNWAWPFETWGVEIRGSSPRRYARRCKIGPVCFGWGEYRRKDPP